MSFSAKQPWLRVRFLSLQVVKQPAATTGEEFWAFQRREALRCLQKQQAPPFVAALLVAAFARAGQLSASFATEVAEQFCISLRESRILGIAALFPGPSQAKLHIVTQRPNLLVDFSTAATLLMAMKEAELLSHPSARLAARAVQHELLLCMQHHWSSMTFAQLWDVLWLLGATAESLGLEVTAARNLLKAAKRHFRKMQKKRYAAEGRYPSNSIALLWPLANISAAMQKAFLDGNSSDGADSSGNKHSCSRDACETARGRREETEELQRDTEIVLQLLKADSLAAVSSRVPCRPLDLALVSLLTCPGL